MNLRIFKNHLSQINHPGIEFDLAPYQQILADINLLEAEYKNKPDTELQRISIELKEKALADFSLDDLLVKAFALVREVSWRKLNMRPFDVQLIAGIVMHQAKLAEMKTGEGKTLAAIMPVYLNSLCGKAVHVLTFNDYLAKRDANWMRPVFEFLGMTVGYIQETMTRIEKAAAYQSDVIYATAKEVGFEYLRSFIAYEKQEIILPPFHYAIIDEADAVLIDEARNPLVLVGNITQSNLDFYEIASFVGLLNHGEDFSMDEYSRNIFLTENGITRIETKFAIANLHAKNNYELLSAINLALHARVLLNRDIDYVVKEDRIKLIDEFTGRIVEDRKWQNGLQMAVEAKEAIPVQSEGTILGSISMQHFIHLYPKISGMTATAQQTAEEFEGFYGLRTVVIPPNKNCIRIDYPDQIYAHKEAKTNAIIKEIKTIHQTGRPILIGTHTVKESEELEKELLKNNIGCKVLNAKNDELEAEIVADAGTLNAVTISTNMAGRGTDIVLGGKNTSSKDKINQLGGLHVIGTNRHESKRIDDQLRGRAGRQGDPGSSCFIISLEDDLMIKYKLKELLPKKFRNLSHNDILNHTSIIKNIDLAQRIIEGQMYEIRKTLFEYTSFIEKQRCIFQADRQNLLNDNLFNTAITDNISDTVRLISDKLDNSRKEYLLNCYDLLWASHLSYVSEIRESIHLVRIGGENPLRVFHKKTDENFKIISSEIESEIISQIEKQENIPTKGIKKPSSTWTYIINDNPFGNQLAIMLLDNSNIGFQVDILTVPVIFIMGLIRKMRSKI